MRTDNAIAAACRKLNDGFTLVELLVAIAIGVVLIAIALPSYQSYENQAKVARAMGDIGQIGSAIQQYYRDNRAAPPDLATIGMDTKLDPWGHPYSYLSFAGLSGTGQMRRDKNLNPINTLFDLYSVGTDGQTKPPLTAPVSQDDVVWANDGGYIGLASNF